MLTNNKSKIPPIILNLIETVIFTFYSDLHIIVFELLLKIGYASEYGIAKEINLNIEKIRFSFLFFAIKPFYFARRYSTTVSYLINLEIFIIFFWLVK